MKRIIVLLSLFIFSLSPAQSPGNSGYRYTMKLLSVKDFFAARDYFTQNGGTFSKFEELVVRAYLDNAFNSPGRSNRSIDIAREKYSAQVGDSLRLDLLRLKQENHGRLYEYDLAAKATGEILSLPEGSMKQEEVADYQNMHVIWTTLSGQPKQEITIAGMTSIRMSRDKAGLANLPAVSGTAAIEFIFDTGANLSTVTQTTARKFGMELLRGKPIEVGAITGAKVMAQLAVCPQFMIGNIVVKNAIFIVFPDDALAFAQIDYQINGIIGFPVIEAFGEIQVTRDDTFIVPELQTDYGKPNMAMDFLTPVLNIDGEYYTFDTGATGTSLYKKYYDRHRNEIDGKYPLSDLAFGGAGGMQAAKGYKAAFRPVIDGKQLVIEPVEIFIDKIGDEESKFYGNIGQDLIRQFEKMTINFDKMFIRFD